VPKDGHRHLAACFALTTLLVALWSAGPALAQTPTEADIRAGLREDSEVAGETLEESGLKRLRDNGRFSITVNPLMAGKMTARVRGKAFTAAYAEGRFSKAGRYRLTLRVTRDGRRYLDATRTARLQLKLGFRRATQP
jgi:hypothetical protein